MVVADWKRSPGREWRFDPQEFRRPDKLLHFPQIPFHRTAFPGPKRIQDSASYAFLKQRVLGGGPGVSTLQVHEATVVALKLAHEMIPRPRLLETFRVVHQVAKIFRIHQSIVQVRGFQDWKMVIGSLPITPRVPSALTDPRGPARVSKVCANDSAEGRDWVPTLLACR